MCGLLLESGDCTSNPEMRHYPNLKEGEMPRSVRPCDNTNPPSILQLTTDFAKYVSQIISHADVVNCLPKETFSRKIMLSYYIISFKYHLDDQQDVVFGSVLLQHLPAVHFQWPDMLGVHG